MEGWRRLLPLLALGGVVAAVYGAGAIGDTATTTTTTTVALSLVDEEAATSSTRAPSPTTLPSVITSTRAAEVAWYYAEVEAICTSAHRRLKAGSIQAGIGMSAPEDGPAIPDRLAPTPLTEDGLLAYSAATLRILCETVPEVRALGVPEALRERYEDLCTLMEQVANGEGPNSWPAGCIGSRVCRASPHCAFNVPDVSQRDLDVS